MERDRFDASRADGRAAMVLALAAVYNVAWGAAVVLAPAATLRWVGLEAASPIALWQCIGMLVGVYGVAYWLAAAEPRRHRAIVLVGWLGKLLGPIGAVAAVAKGTLPRAFLLVNLTNDLLWLGPFTWILWRLRPDGRAAGSATGSLYRRIMGAEFERLAPSLRTFHGAEAPIEVRGTFDVERGASPLANWLADRAGFPRARKDVPVHLRVAQEGAAERWTRSFEGHTFDSRQWNAGGLLAERFGPLTLFLEPRAKGGALEIAEVRATCFGLPLPAFLGPRIDARGDDDDGGVRLRIRVSHPLLGLLVEYGGLVRFAEAAGV